MGAYSRITSYIVFAVVVCQPPAFAKKKIKKKKIRRNKGRCRVSTAG